MQSIINKRKLSLLQKMYWHMMTSLKIIKAYSNVFAFCFLLFWKFLNYLVCVPSSKSIKNSSLSRRKYDRGNFTLIPHQLLRGQNMSMGIGLIELSEPSDTLKYKPSFKNCLLQAIFNALLLFIFVWNKIFCSKNWALFYIFFDLVWSSIRCYSIKDSVFQVLLLIVIMNSLAIADIICWDEQ